MSDKKDNIITGNVDISVVVPIYNCEEFLRPCIDSILAQKDISYEVLLLDDASEDSGKDICREYQDKDNRVVFVDSETNNGVSYIRNKGIDMARGRYIMFVDSDDYIPDCHVLGTMYQKILKDNSDIVMGNYCRQSGDEIVDANRHEFTDDTDVLTGDFRYSAFFSNGIMSYVWCKLYRTDYLRNCNIRFSNLDYAEDKLFNIQCYIRGAVYSFVENNVYCYRKRENSVSGDYHERFDEKWMYISDAVYSEIYDNKLDERYEDIVAYNVFFAVFFHGKQEYVFDEHGFRAARRAVKKYMGYKVARRELGRLARGCYINKKMPLFWKVGMWGFAVCMTLRLYSLLTLGIKLIADMGIDTALSSTGRKLS